MVINETERKRILKNTKQKGKCTSTYLRKILKAKEMTGLTFFVQQYP